LNDCNEFYPNHEDSFIKNSRAHSSDLPILLAVKSLKEGFAIPSIGTIYQMPCSSDTTNIFQYESM